MPGSVLGSALARVEDAELLTGAGCFVDDVPLPGALHVAFVRSPHPHAVITGVDVAAAGAAPGVVAVRTAVDLELPAHHGFAVVNAELARSPLATERVRFVGEAVAVVAAESAAAAAGAAALVEVGYEPLPAVVDPEEALEPGAVLQYPGLGTNLVAGVRSPAEPDPLAGAEVVVRARMVNQRVAVVPLEGNAIAVRPEPDDGLTVWVSTQTPHLLRDTIAKLFGLAADRVRVIAPQVGGAFGGKIGLLAEHTVVVGLARALGRPVRWVESRSENLASMHGRAQIAYYELGLTRAGVITGLRARVLADAGAHAGPGGSLALGPTWVMAQGPYRIPALSYDAAVAVTTTPPVGAFRGAGRAEATAHLERIMDLAAAEVGLDPVELRRRNLVRAEQFPYPTRTGLRYDTGDYERALDLALERADYDGLRAEQVRRRAADDPVQLGIGVSLYVAITGGAGASEFGSVAVCADGTATVAAGTSAHGQGHATAFAMVVADRLRIPVERIRVVQSDTAQVPRGAGTEGSQSVQLGGSAVYQAAGEVLDRARRQAAALLEAAVADVELTGAGIFQITGVPSTGVTWAQLAAAAEADGRMLAAAVDRRQDGAVFPFGAHVAAVEVDVETGRVRLRRHVAVDDCGRVLNPLLTTGQQHGGIAAGVGQALHERVVHDGDGQPLATTLAEYLIPSAPDLIDFDAAATETPTPLNPLGAKGVGESATIGATPAVHNAVLDALCPFGVRHLDLPCTPERVWRAVQHARAGRAAPLWRGPPAVFASLPLRGGTP
jgi:aerobic carbon-monoxide dehydrogenase large subunit